MERIVRCSHKACGLIAALSTWVLAPEPGRDSGGGLKVQEAHCPRCWCKSWYPAKKGEIEKPKRGDELIALERIRQKRFLGYGPEKDDEAHPGGELAGMAACYALNACGFTEPQTLELFMAQVGCNVRIWPVAGEHWKPRGKIDDLVRAGALIAAEIDRLQRLAAKKAGPEAGAPGSGEVVR